MTAKEKRDKLLNRKAELLQQKTELIAEMEAGKTDKFPLFFLNEELMDINAQLRVMKQGHAKAKRQSVGSNKNRASDWQQFIEWDRREHSYDEEVNDAHQVLVDTVLQAEKLLTPRQAEIYAMWSQGISMTAISVAMGIDKSTISRTVTRSKKRIREDAEKRLSLLRMESTTVDLSDDRIARLALSCITAHQAICIYLYYGEWLTLRECGNLLSLDHTSILRTVQRGMESISNFFGGEVTMENVDCIGELAYQEYLAKEDGVPEVFADEAKTIEAGKRSGWAYRTLYKKERQTEPERKPMPIVRNSEGTTEKKDKHLLLGQKKKMGKLLELLLEKREGKKKSFLSWLLMIFGNLVGKKKEDSKCTTTEHTR